jgi:SAM-dependent methyltransferase
MGFDQLAGEYYDAERHRTTAGFRRASDAALERLVNRMMPLPNSSVLEVGAGRPSAPALNLSVDLFVVTDISASMLSHARGHLSIQADALRLPFARASFDFLVAALAAPYNELEFFIEAARVLRLGGCLLMTTPAHEWAVRSRPDGHGGARDLAVYVAEDGSEIQVPSITRSVSEQRSLLKESGFATRAVVTIDVRDLVSCREPDQFLTSDNLSGSLATGFLAQSIANTEPVNQDVIGGLHT